MDHVKNNDRIQLTRDEIVMGFVVSCVEDVARVLDVDYLDVYTRMKAVGLIDNYIVPHYETLHTDSRENVTKGIIETLSRWEGKI